MIDLCLCYGLRFVRTSIRTWTIYNLNEEKYPMKIPIQNLILFLILSILEICIKWKINTPNEY